MTVTVLKLEEPQPKKRFALFELGFRPFFLLASLYAAVVTGLWMTVYFFDRPWVADGLPPTYWHAHEMVFGFATAVVAGFLLTAIKNWTGIQTLQNWRLALLAGFWLGARLLFLLQAPWQAGLAFELFFYVGLLAAISCPLYEARQWRNLSIFFSKVLILALGNVLFYLGWAGLLAEGLRWGLYTGLYMLIALVFTMGRRVIPFFIEKGMGLQQPLRNSMAVDLVSLVSVLGLWIAEMFVPASGWTIGFALFAAFAQVVRLIWWYAAGMWRKPLIWVLWAGLAFVTLGLLMKALAEWKGVPAYAAWHAIAYGGIGLVTAGMMSRASLGHSGRSVMSPPAILMPIFILLVLGALIRSLGPLLLPSIYQPVIATSQLLWILAFLVFFLVHLRIWILPSLGR